MFRTDIDYRPSTNFYASVYSKSSTPKLLGLVNLVLTWDLLLENALPNNLQRIDVVVSSKSTIFTMAIDHGTVSVVGEGDFHESSMTSYGQNIFIGVSQQNTLSASDFTITIYPSRSFYIQYVTSLPLQLW